MTDFILEDWTVVQARTFTKWINTKLVSCELEPMNDLVQDLSDGVKLIQLLEIMSGTPLGRYNPKPKMRVQKAENAKKALDFIRSKDVRLTNIGSEDIVDGNAKLVLGLIWTLILRFTMSSINEEGLQAREGLLLWCQRKTAGNPYEPDVVIRDFKRSWSTGLALCALIHRHRPDLINWDSLDKSDAEGNTQKAFDLAATHLGIPQLLEVSDLCGDKIPDERSVITYVAEFFHAFSSLDKAEVTSRRVEKFATMLNGIQKQQQDYIAQTTHLKSEIESCLRAWADKQLSDNLRDIERDMAALSSWKTEVKRPAAREKAKSVAVFGNIQTRLSENRLKTWTPPQNLAPEDLENDWRNLLKAEATYMRTLDEHYRQLKQAMKEEYGAVAAALNRRIQDLNFQITHMSGSLQEQKISAQRITEQVGSIKQDIAAAAGLSNRCTQAKIDWGDLEPIEDLEYEAQLLEDNIAANLRFIENELVAANHSNVTKDKLLEWQSTWQHFCDEELGYQDLDSRQLQAALASLGHVYSTEDFLSVYDDLIRKHGAVTYQAFVEFLVTITEDSSSPEQLIEAFRSLANGDDVVTEQDLRSARLSPTATSFLSSAMPSAAREETAQKEPHIAYDYRAFLEATFAKV
ncbi:alpha-actinin [Naganishia albida]|nr:alpha-actinin [Naganishia albida]